MIFASIPEKSEFSAFAKLDVTSTFWKDASAANAVMSAFVMLRVVLPGFEALDADDLCLDPHSSGKFILR
jgi:hypothetical protein